MEEGNARLNELAPDGSSLSVVVFAYNEAEALPRFFDELLAWLGSHTPCVEVVFVDDGSRDATHEIAARALVAQPHVLCRHERNRGIGAALRTGVQAATRPWVTFLPADGQIAPSELLVLAGRADVGDVDLVLSTYHNRNDGVVRKIYSLGIRVLIRILHGVHLRSDGPYLVRRSLFAAVNPRSNSFFLNFEFPIRAQQRGARTSGVVIGCRPRQAGHSKSARMRVIFKVAWELLKMRFQRNVET